MIPQKTKTILFVAGVLLFASVGCESNARYEPSGDHPAVADAGQTDYSIPENRLTIRDMDGMSTERTNTSQPAGNAMDAYPLDTCIVSGAALGSMGDPVIYTHEGTEVRFCCASCIEAFEAEPDTYLPKLHDAMKSNHNTDHQQQMNQQGGD